MILEPNAHIYNPSEEDIRADKYYSGWKIWTFRKLREIIFQSSQDDKIMNSGGNLLVVQIPPCYYLCPIGVTNNHNYNNPLCG